METDKHIDFPYPRISDNLPHHICTCISHCSTDSSIALWSSGSTSLLVIFIRLADILVTFRPESATKGNAVVSNINGIYPSGNMNVFFFLCENLVWN